MKKIIFLTLTAAFTGYAFTGEKKAEVYKISTEASTIEWVGTKVTGAHNGNIKIANSELSVKEGVIEGGTINFDMTSITCTDLQGEWGDKLVGHLKSDDFFSVEKFKTATFKIKNLKPIKGAEEGKANYNITGDLTIKRITNEISFPILVTSKGDNIVAIGETNVDRTKWDIKFGSATFFENIGDKAIHNDFAIKFKIAAKK